MKKKFDLEIFFNNNFRRLSRISRKLYVETRASMSGKRFYCSALAGQSAYNICINCDMTVSCNCRDYDGTGHIGDLQANTLQEIFSSATADRFRRSLAAGRVPLLTCVSCPELHLASPAQAEHYITNFSLPTKGIMIENTIVCNYRCSACSREEVIRIRRSKTMSLQDIKIISSTIRESHINTIEFYNLGEPFCYPQIHAQLRTIRDENPEVNIMVSTNGALLNNDEKRDAALLCDLLVFSIDGMDNETLCKYQRGGDFGRAYENMKKLVEYRDKKDQKKPIIEWKYLLFNWNDQRHMILKAIEMAREANVDKISFWPTRMPVYGISWRYYLDGFYKTLGILQKHKRELILR